MNRTARAELAAEIAVAAARKAERIAEEGSAATVNAIQHAKFAASRAEAAAARAERAASRTPLTDENTRARQANAKIQRQADRVEALEAEVASLKAGLAAAELNQRVAENQARQALTVAGTATDASAAYVAALEARVAAAEELARAASLYENRDLTLGRALTTFRFTRPAVDDAKPRPAMGPGKCKSSRRTPRGTLAFCRREESHRGMHVDNSLARDGRVDSSNRNGTYHWTGY